MDKEKDILTDSVDERIESFLRGTMSSDEEEAFKQEIKSNPELRNRAMEMTALAKGLYASESNKESSLKKSIVTDKSTAIPSCGGHVLRLLYVSFSSVSSKPKDTGLWMQSSPPTTPNTTLATSLVETLTLPLLSISILSSNKSRHNKM